MRREQTWGFVLDVLHRGGWRPDVRTIWSLYRAAREYGQTRRHAFRTACVWDHYAWVSTEDWRLNYERYARAQAESSIL